MFCQLSTYKLTKFSERLNNILVKIMLDFREADNRMYLGISKELYEQMSPLDDEKPNKKLEQLYETFKPSEERAYFKQSDALLLFYANSIEEVVAHQNKIQLALGEFFELRTSIWSYLGHSSNSFGMPIQFESVDFQEAGKKYVQLRVLCYNEEKILNAKPEYPELPAKTQGMHFFQDAWNEAGDAVFWFSDKCAFSQPKNKFWAKFCRVFEVSNFCVLSEDAIRTLEKVKEPEKPEEEEAEEEHEKDAEEKHENEGEEQEHENEDAAAKEEPEGEQNDQPNADEEGNPQDDQEDDPESDDK